MISLKNVTKRYGGKVAVDNFTLEVQTGEICVFLGESGCGKSTTLRMINRLIECDEGTIEINGKGIYDYKPEELRRQIGYVVQGTGLFPHMNVRENISVVPNLLGWDKDKILERVKELIAIVGLDVSSYINKYPSELSGGEAQRIGVARALAANPDIILMDEPFGAVDPLNRVNLQNEFLNIQRQLKKTIIFVSHDIEEAIKMGDRIAMISDGKLQVYLPPEEILLSDNEFVNKFLGSEAYIKILAKFPAQKYMDSYVKNTCKTSVAITASLKDILALMIKSGEEVVAVRDENDKIQGNVHLKDIVHIYNSR